MIFVWGKRTYGAVHRVRDIAIKTVFGHLWYLPLFPMTSYYIDTKTGAAFELNGLNVRSVLCGYLRVWLPVIIAGAFIGMQNSRSDDHLVSISLLVASLAALIATYVYDKQAKSKEVHALREMMQGHFGIALDPFECLSSLQQEIDGKMRATSATTLEESWYTAALNDAFADKRSTQLALLRARCDQQDAGLQALVFKKLQQAA